MSKSEVSLGLKFWKKYVHVSCYFGCDAVAGKVLLHKNGFAITLETVKIPWLCYVLPDKAFAMNL